LSQNHIRAKEKTDDLSGLSLQTATCGRDNRSSNEKGGAKGAGQRKHDAA
jgi:hypothetical protein